MKTLATLLLASTAFFTTAASAQSSSTLTYNLNADVGTVCGVYNTAGQTVNVAFGDLATVAQGTMVVRQAGDAVYRCNSVAGFTREISSANNGVLQRTGTDAPSNNRIAYSMQHLGGTDLQLGRGLFQSLNTKVTTNHSGSTAYLTGIVAPVAFQITGVRNLRGGFADGAPGTTVFAGNYTDTVTITVNAR